MSTLKDVYGESALGFEVTTISADMDYEEITLVAPRIHSRSAFNGNGLTTTSSTCIGRFPTDYTQYAVKTSKPIDFTIEKVIYNNPATIVMWKDGTKTVVKCSEDEWYDPEKGLAMAICKKALGNQGNYYNVFTKHLSEYYEENAIKFDLMDFAATLGRIFGTGNSDG